MSVALVGVLPVSAINIGLAAAPPVLSAKIGDLQVSIANFIDLFKAQLSISVNLPDILSITAGLALQLGSLPTLILPTNFLSASVDIGAEIGIDLGLILPKIELVELALGQFNLGLSAGSLAAWSHTGPASGLATEFGKVSSWGGIDKKRSINGLAVLTESPASWGSFSKSMNTGKSSSTVAGPDTDLEFMGVLTAEDLCTGLGDLKVLFELYLLNLNGMKLAMMAQLQMSLGLNLPSIDMLLPSLSIDPSILLNNIVNVNVDLSADLDLLKVQLDGLLELSGSIALQLSAGGLAVYSYEGPAYDFGPSLKVAIKDGIAGGTGPGTPIYGFIVASESPSSWAAFGSIFGGS